MTDWHIVISFLIEWLKSLKPPGQNVKLIHEKKSFQDPGFYYQKQLIKFTGQQLPSLIKNELTNVLLPDPQ